MAKLKVGLIGCGRIVQLVHLNILTHLPDVQLVALAEPDVQRRVEASRRAPSAVSFEDYQELLKKSEADAVVICLPTALHAEAAVAALEQGKHVYLEKPLATSLDEAQKVVTSWRRAAVVGMIGFNYRFNALYQAVRHAVEAGRVGPVVAARSVFSTPSHPLPAWKQARPSGGGVLLDLASHHVDLVRFFFKQEVQSVSASLRSQRAEQDSAVLHLQLADGLLVQSLFSHSAVDEDCFEIYGQAGKLAVDRYRSLGVEIIETGREFSRLRSVTHGLRSFRHGPGLLKKLLAPGHEPSYREALMRFVSAIRGGGVASPDLLDGYRSLEVICAAERSAHTGQSVSLVSSVVESERESSR
jgi:myo-inositol 2-dehydrogenase/D-chiro-inositol 1-dehydrogenase